MGSMHGFRCDPMERVRVGVCGIGQRGIEAIRRLSNIPGLVVTAIADIEQRGLDAGNAELEKMGKPRLTHSSGRSRSGPSRTTRR